MLLIAAVSLWCWAGSLLWRVKGRVSIAIARVQSEFIESISEASHRGSAGFAAVRRGWACGILGCIRQDGGAPGQGGYAAANGMTWRPLAGPRIDPRLPSWGGVSPGRHRATLSGMNWMPGSQSGVTDNIGGGTVKFSPNGSGHH
jgi:hypothetical protein